MFYKMTPTFPRIGLLAFCTFPNSPVFFFLVFVSSGSFLTLNYEKTLGISDGYLIGYNQLSFLETSGGKLVTVSIGVEESVLT